MTYFISPAEETEWNLASSTLAAAIQQQWPQAEVQPVTNEQSNHQLEWRLQVEEYQLDGSLDRTGQAVHIHGDIRACAAFAVWLRGHVPDSQPLVMYDESYVVDVELEKQTTRDQIVNAFMNPA